MPLPSADDSPFAQTESAQARMGGRDAEEVSRNAYPHEKMGTRDRKQSLQKHLTLLSFIPSPSFSSILGGFIARGKGQ